MVQGSTPPGPGRGLVARLLAREVQLLRETIAGLAAGAARLWAARPPPPRAAAMAFLAAASAAGVASVLWQARLPQRLPSARDWDAVRTLLERDARNGDAVLLAPAWAERARELLPPSAPVLPLLRLGGEELLGVRRVWLLSLERAPGFSREREAELLTLASPAGPPVHTGALELARHDLAYPNLPLAFLPDQLSRATASIGESPCAPDGAGFRCAGAPPVRLERAVREVGGAPRPCIAVSLGQRLSAPLAVSFPPVVVGRVLRGHVGALGAPALAEPLRISVQIDGEEAGAAEVSGKGFVPFLVDTGRFAGVARPLSLVVTTPGAPPGICLDAATVP